MLLKRTTQLTQTERRELVNCLKEGRTRRKELLPHKTWRVLMNLVIQGYMLYTDSSKTACALTTDGYNLALEKLPRQELLNLLVKNEHEIREQEVLLEDVMHHMGVLNIEQLKEQVYCDVCGDVVDEYGDCGSCDSNYEDEEDAK